MSVLTGMRCQCFICKHPSGSRCDSQLLVEAKAELAEAKRQYLEADGQRGECVIERDQLAAQLARGGQKADLDRIARSMYPHKSEGFTYTVDFIIDEIARAKRREAELQTEVLQALEGSSVAKSLNQQLKEQIRQLTSRVKTLEDALKAIAKSKSTWNSFAKQALAAKEPKV